MAGELGVDYYLDSSDLARREDIQAVAICTPEDKHLGPCLQAIEHGKAVLVEKPIAHTLKDAEQIRSAAEKRGTLLTVGHCLRFEPRWVTAKAICESGEIGEIQSIHTRRLGDVSSQEILQGRTTLPLYLGVHDFDIARWFAGSKVDTIYAQSKWGVLKKHGYDVVDAYWAIYRFQNGIVGLAELGWALPAKHPPYGQRGITVVGSEGVIEVDQETNGMFRVTKEGVEPVDTLSFPSVRGKLRGIYAEELEHFIECIMAEKEPLVSAEDAIEALRISLAMEESTRTGMPVSVQDFAGV
jgi:predicted dehydrogenase